MTARRPKRVPTLEERAQLVADCATPCEPSRWQTVYDEALLELRAAILAERQACAEECRRVIADGPPCADSDYCDGAEECADRIERRPKP